MKIQLRTPCCKRVVRGAHKMEASTLVLSRICSKCRTSYRVRIIPVYCGASVSVHEALWIAVINPLCAHREVLQ